MSPLWALSSRDLLALANAVETGRLTAPVSAFALQKVLGRVADEALSTALNGLVAQGAGAALRLLAERPQLSAPELAWSGPDATHGLRATAAVVEELFGRAKKSVLVAGFAVVRGAEVFGRLARVMDERPEVFVRFVVNVHERAGFAPHQTIHLFAEEFWHKSWPGTRRPQVFYDPRSLQTGEARAVMHAKCVVVDSEVAFISSANFTPHAQEKNIELGVVMESEGLATQVEAQFESLVRVGSLHRLPGD